MELDEKDHERTLSGRGKRVMDRWRNEKKVMKGVMNGSSGRTRRCVYGREFAVKVLSKRNLDEDALSAQKFEVRYCVFFVHHFPRVYMRIIGYDSSVTPDSFQHCDATPNSRGPILCSFSCSNTYRERTFSIFSSRRVTMRTSMVMSWLHRCDQTRNLAANKDAHLTMRATATARIRRRAMKASARA